MLDMHPRPCRDLGRTVIGLRRALGHFFFPFAAISRVRKVVSISRHHLHLHALGSILLMARTQDSYNALCYITGRVTSDDTQLCRSRDGEGLGRRSIKALAEGCA